MTDSAWTGKTLGIIGGGNMAEALTRGVLAANLLPAGAIIVYDPLPERREVFGKLGCLAVESASEVLASEVILLATKPQALRAALEGLGAKMRKSTLVISIAAGVGSRSIAALLPDDARVIRVMPNTPLLVGSGVAGVARGAGAGDADMAMALRLFACAGVAYEVEETDLDAVTALSGSGPAYLFRFAEALIAGGEQIGLSPELAKNLTINMLRGSAEMLSRFQEPDVLRERVTSPGGTTAAALNVFESGDFTGLVVRALVAARDRGVELGRDQ